MRWMVFLMIWRFTQDNTDSAIASAHEYCEEKATMMGLECEPSCPLAPFPWLPCTVGYYRDDGALDFEEPVWCPGLLPEAEDCVARLAVYEIGHDHQARYQGCRRGRDR